MKKVSIILSLALFSSAHAVTLTVWSHYGGADLNWVKLQADEFEKRTGQQVRVVSVPFGDLTDKWINSAPKGLGPDVVVAFPHVWVGRVATQGVIEPLDKFVTVSATEDGVALNAFNFKDRLFGLPLMAESLALVYNKKLLPNPPTNWTAFLKAAQGNTGNGRFGFLSDLRNAYEQYGVISAYGGYIFRNNGGTFNIGDIGLANAGADKAAAFINNLRYKYGLVPEGVTGDVAKSAFVDGRLAMILTGPWALGDIKRAGINYGITSFPTPPGATDKWRPLVDVQGVVLSSYSKHKALALQFAQQITTQNAQIALYEASGRLPASVNARAQLRNDPVVAGFSKTISVGILMPNVLEMDSVWGPWSAALEQIVQSSNPNYTKILDQAVNEISSSIKKLPQR